MSSTEPPPDPSLDDALGAVAGLAGRFFDWLSARSRATGAVAPPNALEKVKLLHADDLADLDAFPRCQDHDGITLGEYRLGVADLNAKRRSVKTLVAARLELAELDRDDVIEAGFDYVDVPVSLLRRRVSVPIALEDTPGLWFQSPEGQVKGTRLTDVQAGWLSRRVLVTQVGPSRIVNEARITELEQMLASAPPDQVAVVDEVLTSRFGHPVVFISHHWLSVDHPDPHGVQLERLRALAGCFLIFDWSAFPQLPRSEDEQALFDEILAGMDQLVKNVVVLADEDYLTRGWCVYEYIVSSIDGEVVCDEVRDERFVRLRDWANTPPPVAFSFRDGFEARQANYIERKTLTAVNRVLPIYAAAHFRDEHDSSAVTGLLVQHLHRRLPSRREHQQYLGEFTYRSWTDEEIRQAFDGTLEIPDMIVQPIRRFDTAVPATIDEAVHGRFEIKQMSASQLLNPISSLVRAKFKDDDD